jgi:predicted TIM-barrel fold metal-dependent hydrolase
VPPFGTAAMSLDRLRGVPLDGVMRALVVDLHIHLAGLGYPETGCFIRPRLKRTLPFLYFLRRHGVPWNDGPAYPDERFAEEMATHIATSTTVDFGVALAFDQVYDGDGRLSERDTLFYTPNDHLFAMCERYPQLLPGVSIHPYRRDALDELERCVERGAVLVKWLPSVQGMDPGNPALLPFFERLVAHRLPLLVHTGREHTFPALHKELEHPDRLRLPLEAGVTVVAAHAASLGHWPGREGYHDRIALSQEFPNLLTDISGMAVPIRARHLIDLAANPHLHPPLVYGSDYPIPTFLFPFRTRLGPQTRERLARLTNPFDLDVGLKQALGFPPSVFERGYHLLRRIRGPGRDRLPLLEGAPPWNPASPPSS